MILGVNDELVGGVVAVSAHSFFGMELPWGFAVSSSERRRQAPEVFGVALRWAEKTRLHDLGGGEW